MGKDQELLQAVKTEDLLTAQRLLQRPRPGKASQYPSILMSLSLSLPLSHTHAPTCTRAHASIAPFTLNGITSDLTCTVLTW